MSQVPSFFRYRFRDIAVIILSLLILPLQTTITLARIPQEPESAGQAAEQPPPPPTAIPVSEIARAAQQASIRLREIRAKLQPAPSMVEIAAQLPAAAKILQQLKKTPEVTALAELSLRNLETVRQQWLGYQTQFEQWQISLEEQAQPLYADKELLEQMRGVWQKTSETAAAEDFPPALREQIHFMLKTFEELDNELREHLNDVLTLQYRVSTELIDISEILARIETGREQYYQRLFARDSPTLWKALLSPQDKISLSARIRNFWRENLATFLDFLKSHGQQLIFHLIAYFTIAGMLAFLRRRSRRWGKESEDKSLAASTHILARAWSAALLLSLLLTNWVYPAAPLIVYDLAALVILIPLLRLLPQLVPASMRAALYALIGIYIFYKLGDLTPDYSLLSRLVFFAVTALALLGAIWLLRPGSAALSIHAGPWWKAALNATRLGMIALAISLIANLLGYVSIAELLTGATLSSAYLAVLLFAGVQVLEGIVAILLHSRRAASLHFIQTHSPMLKRQANYFIHFLALLVWFAWTLSALYLLEPLLRGLSLGLGKRVSLGSIAFSLGDILVFVIALWVSVIVTRLLLFALEEDVLPRFALPRGVPATIAMLVKYALFGLGFLLALAVAGIDLSRFTLIAGALGVGIGFGLQNVVNNFISGLILAFERPIHIGDVIEVGSLTGTAQRIGIRSSSIRTFDGAEVIVPNGDLISAQVVNWTLSDNMRRIEISIGVAYGTEPKQVLDILTQVAREHPDVLGQPEPIALFREFGDSSLNFTLRFWTSQFDKWVQIRSEVAVALNQALKEAGIQIPFPQRDLHLRSIDSSLKLPAAEAGSKAAP